MTFFVTFSAKNKNINSQSLNIFHINLEQTCQTQTILPAANETKTAEGDTKVGKGNAGTFLKQMLL